LIELIAKWKQWLMPGGLDGPAAWKQEAISASCHSMQGPTNLPGCGPAELRTYLARYGLRGLLFRELRSPFRPERITEPGQS